MKESIVERKYCKIFIIGKSIPSAYERKNTVNIAHKYRYLRYRREMTIQNSAATE